MKTSWGAMLADVARVLLVAAALSAIWAAGHVTAETNFLASRGAGGQAAGRETVIYAARPRPTPGRLAGSTNVACAVAPVGQLRPAAAQVE